MNTLLKIGKIIFQILASIMIILALIIENLSKTSEYASSIKNKRKKYGKKIHVKRSFHSLS